MKSRGMTAVIALGLVGNAVAARAQDAAAAVVDGDKAALEREAALEALAKARQDRQLAALAAIKPAAEGKADVATGGDSAEALILWRAAMREAVVEIGSTFSTPAKTDVSPGCPATTPAPAGIVLVQGVQPPDVTRWLAFRESVRRYETDIKSQIAKWRSARIENDKPKLGANFFGGSLIIPPVAAAILPLFKTDYAIAGTKITVGSDELRAIIAETMTLDSSDLLIPAAPRDIEATLDAVRSLRTTAQGLLDDYDAMAKDKISPPFKAANAALKGLVGQYDGFDKALYTPVAGVLPAVEIDRQRKLWCHRGDARILYILSARSSLTTVTKKNLFTGLGSVPATLRVAVVIDYAKAVGDTIVFGQARSAKAAVPFKQIGIGDGWAVEGYTPGLPDRGR